MEKVKKVLSEISIDQMMDRVRYLTEHFPYRLSGSEDERQAAQYVCDTMRSYGMEIENIQFDTYNSMLRHKDNRSACTICGQL